MYTRKHGLTKTQAKVASVLLAGLLAASPALTAVPVMAASDAAVAGESGEQRDVTNLLGTITVEGVTAEDGVTVTAYQIADGYYNSDDKIVRYVLMDKTNGAIANLEKPTEDEITKIANNIDTGAFTADAAPITLTKGDDGNYTAQAEPGLYLIRVSGAVSTVYNPAVVAVNITNTNDNSTVTGTTVDMAAGFSDFKDPAGTVFLKKSSSDMDKDITDATRRTDTSDKGDTVAIGDTVSFSINSMTVPAYTDDYFGTDNGTAYGPEYYVTDTLDDSFDAITAAPTVTIGGTALVNDGSKYYLASDTAKATPVATITEADGTTAFSTTSKSFRISLTSDYLKTLRNEDEDARSMSITYTSVLGTGATLNFAENHNRATVKYSNNPADHTSYQTIDHDTYHYTFGIDASIDSESGDDEETHEFNKVTEAGTEDTYTEAQDGVKVAKTKKSAKPLSGAEFTLYTDMACTTPVKKVQTANSATDGATDAVKATATSDANGHVAFWGLDEGTYYVKETKAPSGYTIDDHVFKVVIAATLDEKTGVMQSYTITTTRALPVKGQALTDADFEACASASYTAAATKNDDGTVDNTITKTVSPAEVIDTKLQNLPATGGAGTLAITIIASVGMAGFLTLHFANKRKKQQAQG